MTRRSRIADRAGKPEPIERETMVPIMVRFHAETIQAIDRKARAMGLGRPAWLRMVALRALEEGNR